jgi:hypothetical protein
VASNGKSNGHRNSHSHDNINNNGSGNGNGNNYSNGDGSGNSATAKTQTNGNFLTPLHACLPSTEGKHGVTIDPIRRRIPSKVLKKYHKSLTAR